jgi:hypothetical protein
MLGRPESLLQLKPLEQEWSYLSKNVSTACGSERVCC